MERIPQEPNENQDQNIMSNIIACAGYLNKRDVVRMDLTIELPKHYYALWKGIKIAHGLDDDFLSDYSKTMIQMALIKLATFGE